MNAEPSTPHTAYNATKGTNSSDVAESIRDHEAVFAEQLALLEAIYQHAPVGLCVLDRELRYLRINERLADWNGVPAASHIGRTVREVVPDLADALEGFARHVLATGEAVRDLELSGETAAAPGVVRHWLEQWYPLCDASGTLLGVNVVVEDVSERRRATSTLAESEARYRLATEVTGLGTWTWDLRTDVASFDARVRELFGFESDDPLPRAEILATRVHPDDRERVATALAAAADPSGPGRYDAEFRVVHPDGTERWTFNAGQMQFSGVGATRIPTILLGTVLDVTERKRAEAGRQAALTDAETAREVASALVESVRDAFVAYDADFRFTYVNAAAGALFAATGAGDLPVGRVLWEAYPELLGTPVEAAMRRAMSERVPVHFDTQDPNHRRSFAARVYPAAGGGLTAVWADVTAERRAEQAAAFLADVSRMLAVSLDYTATLSAVAHAAVPRLGDWCAIDIVIDPAAREWPPTVERLAVVHENAETLALGATLTERYPTDWSDPAGMAGVLRDSVPLFIPEVTDDMLVVGARDAEHLALLRALRFSSILVVPLVARGLTLGALTLCMTESGRHYDDADLALSRDVAQRAALAVDNARLYRDAERARADAERQRADAEAANAAKSQFLSTMSHELRTPLNAIGGYTELLTLELRGPLTEAQRHDLERIRFANQHLMALVTDILNFARLDAGQLEYQLADVEFGLIVADLEPLIGPQLTAKGIAFDHDSCAPDTPARPHVVRADPERLRQILLNLMTNAVKFTDAGGRVTLACASDVDAGVVRVCVSDTGHGIPSHQLDRIFEPFVQIDRHRTHASQQGVGLGLAISRELARGMNGDLTVESAPGVGTTFTLTLPLTAAGESAPHACDA